MSNKVVGYMLAIPTILFFVFFFAAIAFPKLVQAIDMQIYVVIGMVFFLGLFVSFFKIWKLPNSKNQILPVSNKNIVWLMLTVLFAAGIGDSVELGSQLETLIGIILFILIFVTSYRLIMTKSVTEIPLNKDISNLS